MLQFPETAETASRAAACTELCSAARNGIATAHQRLETARQAQRVRFWGILFMKNGADDTPVRMHASTPSISLEIGSPILALRGTGRRPTVCGFSARFGRFGRCPQSLQLFQFGCRILLGSTARASAVGWPNIRPHPVTNPECLLRACPPVDPSPHYCGNSIIYRAGKPSLQRFSHPSIQVPSADIDQQNSRCTSDSATEYLHPDRFRARARRPRAARR